MRPCRECSKQLLQAGVPQEEGQLAAYLQLQEGFPGGVHQLLPVTAPVELLTSETVRVEVPLN
jgi:hypothetical protein